jgi:hypothetical protein
MRPLLRVALSALVLIAGASRALHAQQPPEPPKPPPQRAVVPVFTVEPIPGVNGSSWTTDLWLSNRGSDSATVMGVAWDCEPPLQCENTPATVDPNRSFQPQLVDAEGALHGEILWLDGVAHDDLRLSLRFRDLSRQGSTAGTEIPIPREADFSGQVSLVDVPVEDGFRQTLRIYSLEQVESVDAVGVAVYRMDPSRTGSSGDADEFLGASTVTLVYPPPVPAGVFARHPGYAEITDLSTLAPLGDAQHLRIQIGPAGALRLWAFATVIHNDSQHATVITPQ